MAPSDEGELRIGLNVRAARRSRGMSLEALAGLTGRFQGMAEQDRERPQQAGAPPGHRRAGRGAGGVGGQPRREPAPEIQRHSKAYSFRALRSALLDATIDDPRDMPARPVAVLAELTASQDAALRRADYDTLTQQVAQPAR